MHSLIKHIPSYIGNILLFFFIVLTCTNAISDQSVEEILSTPNNNGIRLRDDRRRLQARLARGQSVAVGGRAGSRAGLTGRSCRIGPDETCGNFCWLASPCQTCLSATSPPQRGDSRTSSRLGGETPAGARVCGARKNLRRKVKVLLCTR